MEHEVERVVPADLATDRVLDLAQHLRTQLDRARLVDAVNVAEREGSEIPPPLSRAQHLHGPPGVFDGGVQLLVDPARGAVLLVAHHAHLDLENGPRGGGLLEELFGQGEIVLQRNSRPVPHVALEQRFPTLGHAFGRDGHQRPEKHVELVLGTVVGVDRYVH